MNCPNCNAKLPASANYCDQCGFEFEHSVPMASNHPMGPSAGFVPARRALTGTITRPVGMLDRGGISTTSQSGKGDWMHRLIIKCIIVTVATLAVAVTILSFNPWPGCLISASLLLYAIAGTVGCIAIPWFGLGEDLEQAKGADRAYGLLNQIINLSVIWELFWLATGLVCLMFSWWAVLIAEFVNLSVLMMLIVGIVDDC